MIFQDVVLGLVQGLTEFLPVSSSGHLIIAHELLGITTRDDLAFDAVLQLGTMAALLLYFREDLARLIRVFFRWITGKKKTEDAKDIHLIQAIIVGTIPALFFGLLLEKSMESTFRSTFLVAIVLIAGSALMAFAEYVAKQKNSQITAKSGFMIGLFQCLALVPGMSRSGATMSGGLILGFDRETATRFSFLLSIPIITGSGLLQLIKFLSEPHSTYEPGDLRLGFLISFLFGYLSIHWLLRFIRNHRLTPFIWYRLGLASVVIIWSLVR